MRPRHLSDFVGECKPSGDHLNFKVCPVCGDARYKVYVQPFTGWWFCFSGAHNRGGRVEAQLSTDGRVAELLEMLRAEKPVASWEEIELPPWEPLSRSALRYLANRDISAEYARKRGIVEWTDQFRVLVPYFNDAGELIFWTSRRYTDLAGSGPKYIAAPGTKPLYTLHANCDRLVLVEGVFDAMAVQRAGFAAVALHGKSLPNYLQKYFLTIAGRYGIIDVMLDTDAFGSAIGIRNSLLTQRVIGIKPYAPGKDPAEMCREEIEEILLCV